MLSVSILSAAKSGGLDATGSVALAADTIGVELKGGLADISKLAPDTEGAIGFQIERERRTERAGHFGDHFQRQIHCSRPRDHRP